MEKINYNRHLSLIKTLPTSSTRSPPQPHINDPIADSGCTGHYLYALTTIVHTRDPSENPINVKSPNSSKMASTHQPYIPLKFLSTQAKHAEIFPNLHSSLISIGQLCDDKCIVTFDNHKVKISKNKDIIIERYRDPKNILWRFPVCSVHFHLNALLMTIKLLPIILKMKLHPRVNQSTGLILSRYRNESLNR